MIEIITFDVYIDDLDETGIDKVSLVKRPAIMENFIYMNEELPEAYQKVVLSDDKRIITGPALIPELEIIRKDEEGNPFYIRYNKQQIEVILQKFAKVKSNTNVNKDHKADVSDVYMYEYWLSGKSDKSHDLGMDFPEGTLMVSMKVDNDEMWDGIKSGKYKGFSIEGLFKFKRSSKLVKQEEGCCVEDVELAGKLGLVHPNCRCSLNQGNFQLAKNACPICVEAEKHWFKQGTFENVFGTEYNKRSLGNITIEFEEEKNKNINMVSTILKDGNTLYTDADAFKVGVDLYLLNGEEKLKVDNGEYELEDGTVYIVEDSKLKEIKDLNLTEETTPATEEVKQAATIEDLVAYLDPILKMMNDKLDALSGSAPKEDTTAQEKLAAIEIQLEKLIVLKENTKVETIDDKKEVKQSKSGLSYETIVKYNKRF